MSDRTMSRLKMGGAFIVGAFSVSMVVASGIFDMGRHSGEHDNFKQHMTDTKPLVERFILTEQAVKNIEASLKEIKESQRQFVIELQGLRHDLDRREAAK